MQKFRALQKVAAGFGYVEQDSSSLAPSAGKGTNHMTETAVRKIIREKLVEAVAELQKQSCPHCGKTLGAAKVVKSADVGDFWDRFYAGRQSPSGGLFGPPSSAAGAQLTKADQSQSPSGGLFGE